MQENTESLLTQYADDTNILSWKKSVENTINKASQHFIKIEKLFNTNQLILNKEKRTAIFFRTKKGGNTITDYPWKQHTTARKFLKIPWSLPGRVPRLGEHVRYASRKLNSTTYALRSISSHINEATTKTFTMHALKPNTVSYFGGPAQISSIFLWFKSEQ